MFDSTLALGVVILLLAVALAVAVRWVLGRRRSGPGVARLSDDAVARRLGLAGPSASADSAPRTGSPETAPAGELIGSSYRLEGLQARRRLLAVLGGIPVVLLGVVAVLGVVGLVAAGISNLPSASAQLALTTSQSPSADASVSPDASPTGAATAEPVESAAGEASPSPAEATPAPTPQPTQEIAVPSLAALPVVWPPFVPWNSAPAVTARPTAGGTARPTSGVTPRPTPAPTPRPTPVPTATPTPTLPPRATPTPRETRITPEPRPTPCPIDPDTGLCL